MTRGNPWAILLTLALVLVPGVTDIAWGYAGFSRSYNLPCEFCHIQWPKLSDQGEFFRDRGFMLSTTGTGNGLDLMFLRPEGQSYFPIGFHMSMAYGGAAVEGIGISSERLDVGNADPSKISALSIGGNGSSGGGTWGNGAVAPTPWALLSGGLLSPSISFWVEPGLRSPVTVSPALDIFALWVRFDNLFGTTLFNLYAGVTGQDTPFSNRRALIGTDETPYVMDDYMPGTAEVVTNSGIPFAGFGAASLPAYYDADRFQMKNAHTAIRYFGYLFENGCGSEASFSFDPCETRLSVSFMPNAALYGNPDGLMTATGATAAGIPPGNNGFSFFTHLTQSFGGWGATNGERIGLFSLVGQSALSAAGTAEASPDVLYTREGVDLSINPLPDGELNLFGAWEIVNDPAEALVADPAIFGSNHPAISGLSYMTWFLEGDWQPSFHGFFESEGAGSDIVILTYNQLRMLAQPVFAGIAQSLPGNFDNVISFGIADRYWLYGSSRTAISLFAEWQWMENDGVGSAVTQGGTRLEGFGAATGAFSNSGFYNVTSSVFLAGVDFSY